MSLNESMGEHVKTHAHKLRVTKWNKSMNAHGGGTNYNYDLSERHAPLVDVESDPSGRGR
ncbi:hypothetical protein KAR91_28470 [Candidatus Pacearchaeota archaeon]|nr:hypothetical protein [Candidatus Pacearchaeota archaeon]